MIMRIAIRRIRCQSCGSSKQEPISFCSKSHVGYTKWLESFVIALRKSMTITDVAKFTGLHWQSVKDIERNYASSKKTVGRFGLRQLSHRMIQGDLKVFEGLKTIGFSGSQIYFSV